MPDANKLLQTIVVMNDFSYVNGGASQVALASAKGFAAQGYRVILFSAVAPIDASLAEAGVEIVHTGQHESIQDPNTLRAAVQGLWNSRARSRLRIILRSLDPKRSVVHVHSWVKALSSSIVRESAGQGFSVFCTLHDYFSACPNGGFFDYQIGEPCGEVAMSRACIRRNCDPRSYAQKLWRVARQAIQIKIGGIPDDIAEFISVSQFSEDTLRPYLSPTATVHRVANPIEAERSEPADLGQRNGYVFVGRLVPEKGAVNFAHAAARIGVRAVFVGDGQDSAQIKSICPNAEITGWVPRPMVTQKIRCAQALVLPSLWYETQGLVVAEAASQGIPAIVSDRCAARDAVSDGETGLLYSGGEVDDLVRKLLVMGQPATANRLGRNAFDVYWANPMTLRRHLEELDMLYTSCLERRARMQISVA